MNVQQSQHAKIALVAAAMLILLALTLVPKVAFAGDAALQGQVAGEVEAEKQVKNAADDAQQPGQEPQVPATSQVISAPQEQLTAGADDPKADDPKTAEADDPKQPESNSAEEEERTSEVVAGGNTVALDDGTVVNVLGTRTVQRAQNQEQVLSAQGAQAPVAAAKSEAPKVLSAQSAQSSTSKVGLSYNTHVQNDGWQKYVSTGQMAGTTGRSLRLEGIHLTLTGMGDNKGHIYYQTHVQNDGWQAAVADGDMAGTTGRSLRLEGIKIWLSGDIANHFDVFYRTHVQNIGWQGWVKNGAVSGTTGQSLRLEGIEIRLSAKTEEAAGNGAGTTGVRYETHVQNVGWQEWTGDGKTAGTTGRSLRVEALNIVLSTGAYKGGISYQAHVQNVGWQNAVSSGQTAGTTGRSLRVEALRIKLTGDIEKQYNVYYRTHVQNYGWLDWASNGADSGSTGHALRVEALEIVLKKKGEAAPGPTANPTVNKLRSTLDGIDIASWQAGINIPGVPADFVIVKATGGTGYVNPYWKGMASSTVNSGKLLGLYHFAREEGCRGSAIQEADYFVDNIGGYAGSAVLVLDWEAEALNQGPGWAKQFLDRVYERTHVRPMIYMSKSVTRSYDWSSVAPSYKLWVAQYPDYNKTGYQSSPWTDGYGYGAWGAPTMFQYASTGRLSGYGGDLDLNKFYGSQADWRSIASKR